MNVEEFEELKDEVMRLKSSHEQRKGEMNTLLRQLKEEFDCEDIESAEELLKEMENQIKKLEEKLDTKTQKLKQDWEAFKGE